MLMSLCLFLVFQLQLPFLALKGDSKLKAYIRNFHFQFFLDLKTAVDLATSSSATFRQPLTIPEPLATFIPLSIMN